MRRLLVLALLLGVLTACSGTEGVGPIDVRPPDVDVDTPALREVKARIGMDDCVPGEGEAVDGGLPDVTLPCLGGGPDVDLASLRGPMVINLWQARCEPCRREMPALEAASLHVQEDLVLMRRSDAGWRLVAGALCFPSSWTLAEKFGRPLHEIHEPVPGFGPETRTAGLIDRIFDNLAPELPVERLNWSIQSGGALYHPLSSGGRVGRSAAAQSRFPGGDPAGHAFVRVERQTLRKLPACGDILFTIGIHLDPLVALRGHPDRRRLAAAFAAQLSALDADQIAYKGLGADRDGLVELLGALAGGD